MVSGSLQETLVAMFGGGGLGYLGAWLKGRAEMRRATTEASVNLAKLNPELAAIAIDTVETANSALRGDNEILRGERDYYRERLNQALAQLDEVSEDLRKAQAITARLQAQISTLLEEDVSESNRRKEDD